MKKLRATLTIDIDAESFMEAGEIEKDLGKLADELAEKYTRVTYDFRERREFKGAPSPSKKSAPSRKRKEKT